MLLGRSSEKLRTNPRTSWYRNLDRVTADSDHEATFHLKRPQPAFIAFLASGFSPVYPCHVSPRDMRQARSAVSRRHRVHDYKKPRDRNPRLHPGKFDMTFPYQVTIPLMRDVKTQVPEAICELKPNNVRSTLLINRNAPPSTTRISAGRWL